MFLIAMWIILGTICFCIGCFLLVALLLAISWGIDMLIRKIRGF
jgi:hypothetical protein